jgi:guanylate kinase
LLLHLFLRPSGTGKTTLAERLVQILPNLRMSRSYTSRPARAGERDGVDYNFVSREHFEGMINRGEFLEWADVFGNLYGTHGSTPSDCRHRGRTSSWSSTCRAPSRSSAAGSTTRRSSCCRRHSRFSSGGCEAEAPTAKRRCRSARRGARRAGCYVDYDYVVINDQLEPTVVRLQEIIAAERSRRDATG